MGPGGITTEFVEINTDSPACWPRSCTVVRNLASAATSHSVGNGSGRESKNFFGIGERTAFRWPTLVPNKPQKPAYKDESNRVDMAK